LPFGRGIAQSLINSQICALDTVNSAKEADANIVTIQELAQLVMELDVTIVDVNIVVIRDASGARQAGLLLDRNHSLGSQIHKENIFKCCLVTVKVVLNTCR
jgi:hypothetical protein